MIKKRIFVLIVLIVGVLLISASAEEGVFPIEDFGDYKLVATYRTIVTPPHGPSFYWHQNFGVTDKNGNFVLEPKYDEIKPHVNGRAIIKAGGLYGYCDENWNIVIEPKYTYATDFSEGLAAVCDNSGTGYIDTFGNIAIPFVYSNAYPFKNGEAIVAIAEEGYFHTFLKDGKIDKQGNLLIEPKYHHDSVFDVTLSTNDIELNGILYKNDELEYPFINYMWHTYIPLTYYGCKALGIDSHWSPETGLVLYNSGSASALPTGKNTMKIGVYEKATLYSGTLTLNGKTYSANDAYYPILSYKNIVYIPVLWRQGMEALGISYTYRNAENGNNGCMVFTK